MCVCVCVFVCVCVLVGEGGGERGMSCIDLAHEMLSETGCPFAQLRVRDLMATGSQGTRAPVAIKMLR